MDKTRLKQPPIPNVKASPVANPRKSGVSANKMQLNPSNGEFANDYQKMLANSIGSKGQLPHSGSNSNFQTKPVGLLGQQNLVNMGDSDTKMNFAKMGSSILSGSNMNSCEAKQRSIPNYNTETNRQRGPEDSAIKRKM